MHSIASIVLAGVATFAIACSPSGDKAPVEDPFAGAAGGKGDHLSVGLIGALDFGESSGPVLYRDPPRYLAFELEAEEGDSIDVRVRAVNGGDAVAWVLDSEGSVLASNDDESASSLDARIRLDIGPTVDPFHTILFRDYHLEQGVFEVTLDGQRDFTTCKRDSDCQMIDADCCPMGDWIAVRADRVDDYQESLECDMNQICPRPPLFDNGESAICDNNSNTCEVLLPGQIRCGGHPLNPHACPDGFECVDNPATTCTLGTSTCPGICQAP